MKHIVILVANAEVDLTTLSGALEIFGKSNDYVRKTEKRIPFKIELVGVKKDLKISFGGTEIPIKNSIDEIQKPHLIIIPSNNLLSVNNTRAKQWIRDCYTRGSEVASLCVGAFLLASTGLLDGKNCSTHWMMANEFQQSFPKVKLCQHQIITDQDGLYTSGGAYSFLNLILYLLEKYENRDLALWAAKMFGIAMDRKNQSQFIVFQGQKKHKDEAILNVQKFIESNFEQRILVSELEKMANMDSRNFIRRFKKATYNTPLEYVQRVKIEAAKRFLELTDKNITEIKYSLSWTDDKSFRNIFKKHTGLTPVAYKKKYSRNG